MNLLKISLKLKLSTDLNARLSALVSFHAYELWDYILLKYGHTLMLAVFLQAVGVVNL